MKISKLKEMIMEVLLKYKETRDSDTLLTIMIWRIYYNNYIFKQDDLGREAVLLCDIRDNLPKEDAVKRIRAKLQENERYNSKEEDWKIQPSPEVKKQRQKLQKEFREELLNNFN